MTKKKILIILAVVVLGGGYAAYNFVAPKASAHDKITGTIYILPKAFTLNLADGRYATLTAALVLAPGQSTGATGEGAPSEPDGFGTLPEEAAVRDIITNVLTNQNGDALTSTAGRKRIKRAIVLAIRNNTDVKVTGVLFTDVAVQ